MKVGEVVLGEGLKAPLPRHTCKDMLLERFNTIAAEINVVEHVGMAVPGHAAPRAKVQRAVAGQSQSGFRSLDLKLPHGQPRVACSVVQGPVPIEYCATAACKVEYHHSGIFARKAFGSSR